MATSKIHLELLLSKQVLDSTGKVIGSIQEVRAEKQGDEWVVKEYLVGTGAVLERLSAWKVGLGILRLLGARKIDVGCSIPWDKLDLNNPDIPRFLGTLDELKTLSSQQKQKAEDS